MNIPTEYPHENPFKFMVLDRLFPDSWIAELYKEGQAIANQGGLFTPVMDIHKGKEIAGEMLLRLETMKADFRILALGEEAISSIYLNAGDAARSGYLISDVTNGLDTTMRFSHLFDNNDMVAIVQIIVCCNQPNTGDKIIIGPNSLHPERGRVIIMEPPGEIGFHVVSKHIPWVLWTTNFIMNRGADDAS